jgi:hypothetical protein
MPRRGRAPARREIFFGLTKSSSSAPSKIAMLRPALRPDRRADGCEGCGQHRPFDIVLRKAAALKLEARCVDDGADDGDQPFGGDVAPENSSRLAPLEKRDVLRCDREMPAAQLLR